MRFNTKLLAEYSIDIGDSKQRSVYKSLPTSQRKNSIAATLSWSILLTNYGATWFTLVLHRAPLAFDTYMLVCFRILLAQISYCMAARASRQILALCDVKALGPTVSCFDVTQCQYLPCGTRNHTITNTWRCAQRSEDSFCLGSCCSIARQIRTIQSWVIASNYYTMDKRALLCVCQGMEWTIQKEIPQRSYKKHFKEERDRKRNKLSHNVNIGNWLCIHIHNNNTLL